MRTLPIFAVVFVISLLANPVYAGQKEASGGKGADGEPECDHVPVTRSLTI